MSSPMDRSAVLVAALGGLFLAACVAPHPPASASSHLPSQGPATRASAGVPVTPIAKNTPPAPVATAGPSLTSDLLDGLASRNDPFAVRCNGGIELLRTDSSRVISSIPLDITECTVAWSPDSTTIAVLTPDSRLFISSTDGRAFNLAETLVPPIGMTRLSAWSPDSQRVAVTQGIASGPDSGGVSGGDLVILDRATRELHRFSVSPLSKGSATLWLGNAVVAVADQEGMDMYRADDGRPLGHCACGPDYSVGPAADQFPLVSPDGKWVSMDRSSQDPYAGSDSTRSDVYEVVDVVREARYSLSAADSTGIDFLEWKKDSTAFFFISHPEGLMAFDTGTLKVQSLFDLAWDARFSPNQEWAFVLFPSHRASGGLSLSGGVWQVGTSLMLGRHTISDSLESVPLPSGVDRERMGMSGVIPVAWSNDGTHVAWIDALGRLLTQSIRGADRVLSEKLFTDYAYWVRYGEISWSEDDATIVLQAMHAEENGTESGARYKISSH